MALDSFFILAHFKLGRASHSLTFILVIQPLINDVYFYFYYNNERSYHEYFLT